jgi:hypothetical protein
MVLRSGRGYVLLLAALAVVVTVPSAFALGANAVAGGNYEYVKVLPKDPGWHSPTPKENIAGARVSPDGKSVRAGWVLWTDNGCRGTQDGRPLSYPSGDTVETAISPTGTFHAIDTRPPLGGTRYHRAEIYGQFAADGSYVTLRLRNKLDVVEGNGSLRFRCDGRWLSFRAPLRRGKS